MPAISSKTRDYTCLTRAPIVQYKNRKHIDRRITTSARTTESRKRMSTLKLFISHSSRFDDVAQNQLEPDHNWKLLEATCKELKDVYKDRIEILVDQDKHGLYPSCDWEQRLNEWLAECHAAIILFSKRARETSQWVRKEATILSWRREIEKGFKLIPVLLEGQCEPADLEQDVWSTLRILESQCKRSASTSQEIIEAVKSALGDPEVFKTQCPQTPYERLESLVGNLLQQGTNKTNLRDVWEHLEASDTKPPWHPDETNRFAAALARYLLRDSESCLLNFRHVIDKLHPNPEKARVEELLKAIRSIWVDAKAAGLIPGSREQQGMVAMNGQLLFFKNELLRTNHYTLDRYLERAWPETDMIKVIPVTGSTTTENIKKEIRSHFSMQQVPIPDALVDQLINDDPSHLMVYLQANESNGGVPDPRLLNKLSGLRKTYNKVIIIFGTGDTLPAISEDKLIAVEPALDLIHEARQFYYEIQARELLDRKYGNQP